MNREFEPPGSRWHAADRASLMASIQAQLEAESIDGRNPTHVVPDGLTSHLAQRQEALRRRIAAIPVTR